MAGRALAETRIRLEYAAPASCPDRASWETTLRARTSELHLVTANEAVRMLSVTIRADGERLRGTLAVREIDGTVMKIAK